MPPPVRGEHRPSTVAAMGTTRAAAGGCPVPRRRKHDEAAAGRGRNGSRDVAAPAGASSGGGGSGAPVPRPLISGPAPFQLPRWPLRPLDGEEGGGEGGAGGGVGSGGGNDNDAPPAAAGAASLAQARLRVGFEGARADAVALGVPFSALPAPREGASADELAAALAHTQDVISSFVSANI